MQRLVADTVTRHADDLIHPLHTVCDDGALLMK